MRNMSKFIKMFQRQVFEVKNWPNLNSDGSQAILADSAQ